ncbi:MAG: alkaline phosphatase family protein, partial [Bellilinea sp.]
MKTYRDGRGFRLLVVAAIVGALLLTAAAPLAVASAVNQPTTDKLVFFAADGLRQDLAEKYAAQGSMPAFASMFRTGVQAGGYGLLTQAPPNTGSGWYSLSTGAWPGVHGST